MKTLFVTSVFVLGLATLSGGSAVADQVAARPTPRPTPKLEELECSIQDLRQTEIGPNYTFKVLLTDHELQNPDDFNLKWVITKRVAIPKHPGYFVDIHSNPNVIRPDKGPQGIVMYVKETKYLDLSPSYASTLGNGRVYLSVTFPREEYASVGIDCGTPNYLP